MQVARLHGVNPFCHFFSDQIANTVYVGDKPLHIRFYFNADSNKIRTEQTFLMAFVITEKSFQPAVEAMREYCALTEEASNSYVKAIANLDRRVELLEVVQSTIVAVGKVFRETTQGDKIDGADWRSHVQVPASWGLDGGKGGGSGGELLTFQLLDEFLHVPGKCLIYTNRPHFQYNMPTAACDAVNAMAISDPGPRFDSYIGLEQSKNPLWKAREAILRSLHLWRLGHAQVVGRVLTGSENLASNLDKKMERAESVGAEAKRELLQRARETQSQFRKMKPQV